MENVWKIMLHFSRRMGKWAVIWMHKEFYAAVKTSEEALHMH